MTQHHENADDLVARLLNQFHGVPGGDDWPELKEAADALEAKQAEIERLNHDRDGALDLLTTLEQRIHAAVRVVEAARLVRNTANNSGGDSGLTDALATYDKTVEGNHK